MAFLAAVKKMSGRHAIAFCIVLLALLATAMLLPDFLGRENTLPENRSTGAQLANPASIYCTENGGRLEIKTDASGGQYGMCILQNGTECEEWAYYRGECA